MVLGLLLALLGGVVAARSLRQNSKKKRVLIDAPFKLFATISIGVVYVALVVPLGFYTASFLVMLVLPVTLGFRRVPYALVVGAIFIGIVYVVFSVLLEKPLPREWFLTAFRSG